MVLASGVTFFVVGLGHVAGWGVGHTVMVLTMVGVVALMAVSLDRME